MIDHGVRLYIPAHAGLREQLIAEHHDTGIAGHFGRNRVLAAVQQKFWWPQMKNMIAEYIRSCPACQQNKGATTSPAGTLQPLEISEDRWASVSMDFIVRLPETKAGFDAIMVVVDRLTKYAFFIPTHTSATAVEAAQVFFNRVVCTKGLPRSIVSDRDSRFVSAFWKGLWAEMGTKLKMSTAYHPQTDGQTERMNRVLEEMLRTYCVYSPERWDEYLPQAMFAYNNSVHASTGYSPHFLNYGQHANVPASLLFGSGNAAPADVDEFVSQLDLLTKRAVANLKLAQASQKKYADQHRREVIFKPGDLVLLAARNVSLDGENPPKLRPKFVGPFKVLNAVGKVAYTLEMPSFFRGHPTFHVSVLKKWHVSDKQFPTRAAEFQPPPLFYQGGDAFYSVQQIVSERGSKSAKEYRIQWQGWKERTWEPATEIEKAVPLLVAEYKNVTAAAKQAAAVKASKAPAAKPPPPAPASTRRGRR